MPHHSAFDDLEQQLLEIVDGPRDAWDQAVAELRKRHPDHRDEIDRCLKAAVGGAEFERLLANFPDLASPGIDPLVADEDPDGDAAVAAAVAALRDVPPELPTAIGPYRILDTLGVGGMGQVYLAEQRQPVRRRVAIKVIKLGMDTKQVLARFEQERQALAVMSHPAIAKVHDAGVTDLGQPYFVMEFVEGVPLARYCDEHRLSLEDRIGIFQQVCRGVHHAHQKGVLHRDLKPANILVSRSDDQHVVKIIDFGLARATDHQLVDATIYTELGQVIGTPEYMSPEQAGGQAQDIDTRTDIYSLGVILYELLTGSLPFESFELRSAGLVELQRIIREQEPPKPSARISTDHASGESAQRRRLAPETLRRHLRGDLDWIVMRAMSKEPHLRYESATSLAHDLDRYLNNEPVEAGPPRASYRLRKTLRRYRIQVVALALVLLSAVIGTFVSLSYAFSALQQAERFDLLTVQERIRIARAELAGLRPPWPTNTRGLQDWQDTRVPYLQHQKARIDEKLREMSHEVNSPSTGNNASASAAAETRGSLEATGDTMLRRALENAQTSIEEMLARDVGVATERLEWSKHIANATVHHPGAAATWEAIARDLESEDSLYRHQPPTTWSPTWQAIREAERRNAIAANGPDWTPAPAHPDQPLRLIPQMGLVPMGKNPATELWEFYHLRSARLPPGTTDPISIPIPRHDPKTGRIAVTEATGIVFVLIPGGLYRMGSQSADPNQPNYDKLALPHEPVIPTTVPAFFMARHELTQAQWVRLSTHKINPSFGGTENWTHPVQQVDWQSCHDLFADHGLRLPTDAEWEYACRGWQRDGFTTWSSGNDLRALVKVANVYDRSAPSPVGWADTRIEFSDGQPGLAPVGSLAANDFGMHDMHGNVFEWTADFVIDESSRRHRGGSYESEPAIVRSASRFNIPPTSIHYSRGVRAARSIYD